MEDNILRRITTSVGIISLVGVITFFLPDWVFCLMVVAFIGLALYEFFSIVEKKDHTVYKYFGITAGIIIPVAIHLHLGGGYANLEPFFIVMACLFAFVRQFTRKEEKADRLHSVALTLFALFYISWFFSFFIKIKFLPAGAYLVSFLILVTKSGDIGAYFVGKKIGKSLLIPRISPKKTKAGAIGGLIFSIIVSVLCKGFLPDVPIYHAILLGILLGVIGQVGDLAESLFKRDFDVKDAGHTLPGLGGVLDTIDSLLFTTPIFYFYVKLLL